MKSHPYIVKYDLKAEELKAKLEESEIISIDKLRMYIKYAREKCRPSLGSKNYDVIKEFYKAIRKEAETSGGIDIGVRHLESIIRITMGT